mgnify:CR=1 FL=1
MPSFPSRGKNNASETSPPPLPSLLFASCRSNCRDCCDCSREFVRLMRERERLLFDESATFTRVCDGCANDCQMRHFCDTTRWTFSLEREKNAHYFNFHRIKMISLTDEEGFLRSASMILASEIGDKTFFIAAILAMNHSRLTVRYETTRVLMCSLIPI